MLCVYEIEVEQKQRSEWGRRKLKKVVLYKHVMIVYHQPEYMMRSTFYI